MLLESIHCQQYRDAQGNVESFLFLYLSTYSHPGSLVFASLLSSTRALTRQVVTHVTVYAGESLTEESGGVVQHRQFRPCPLSMIR